VTTLAWALTPVTPPAAPTLPTGSGIATGAPSFLGFGLVLPFQRGPNDFAADGGANLVKSCGRVVLGTRCDSPISNGELPWRTEMGAVLQRLRHKNNNPALAELAQAYVADALGIWEPRIAITSTAIVKNPAKPRALYVRIGFDIIASNVPGNAVTLPDQSIDVPIPPSA
jgi:hypothetical protein